MEKEIIVALQNIQKNLIAPKGQYNDFGRYKYRSCEDVLEALKPLLSAYSCSLMINDEIVLIGDRYYVKATATLLRSGSQDTISVSAFAREPKDRKGMDESQITGATSSYARKYALNGLFAIDDNKDPDSTNEHDIKPKVTQVKEEKVEAAPSITLKGMLEEQAIKKFGSLDKFKMWRTDNNYAETLEGLSDFALAQLMTLVREYKGAK